MYTLIANKPESRYVVCGDTIDSWRDDFNFHSYLNVDQLVSLCANYHGRELGTHEIGYTLIVHTNIEGYLAFCEDLMSDDFVSYDKIFYDIHIKVKAAIQKIKDAEEEEKSNQKRIKARNEVLMEELKKSQKEKNERKEFERLKAIYEKPEPKREWTAEECPCKEIGMDPKENSK